MEAQDWRKIHIKLFSDAKIRYLRRLPDGDTIVLLWVMLITMADYSGRLYLAENIPYDCNMLAMQTEIEESTVFLALESFRRLGMLTDDDVITIKNWGKYQNVDGLKKMRESKRISQAKWRERQKALSEAASSTVDSTVDSTVESTVDSTVESQRASVDDTEEEIKEIRDKEIRDKEIRDKEIRVLSDFPAEKSPEPHPADIVNLFNSICTSFPQVKQLTENRKKAIKARLKTYKPEDFETVFRNAENSAFLKGKNKRNWSATFDWMLQDSNFAKILEGNYSDSKAEQPQPMRRMDSDELEAIRQMMGTG